MDPAVTTSNPVRKAGESPRQQSVCIEIPVTVHGSRLASGNPNATLSGKTFVEVTRTMIVFPQGAVLRLLEPVSEGQILILKNPGTKQEVACRVVNSKTNTTAKGYIEVEFFQPTAGFWGISFPSGASAGNHVEPAASAHEDMPKQVRVAPPAPRAIYSKAQAPVVVPPVAAPVAKPAAPTPSAAAPSVEKSSNPVPVPMQTQELNRAIVAAYAAKCESPRDAAPAAVEEPAPSEPVKAVVPVPVMPAPKPEPAPVIASVAAPPKFTPISAPVMPPRVERIKPEAKPLVASKEVVSSTPIAMADAISAADTEFAAYSNVRGSLKQGLPPTAIVPISKDLRRSESAAETKALETTAGSHLQLQATEPETYTERSSRTWLIVGVAAAVLLTAGAGAYWWRTQTSLAGAKPLVNSAAVAPNAPALTPSNQPVALPVNSHSTPGGSAASAPPAQKTNAPTVAAAENSAASKSTKSEVVISARRPNVIPDKIAAPSIRSNGASKQSVEPLPDVIGRAPATQTAAIGSILAPNSSPAAPPPPKPSGPPPVASVFIQPKLLTAVQPVYPRQAYLRGDSGDVVVDALVDQYGKVVATKVLSGPMTLREAAAAAVSEQKYAPAKLNGEATSAHVIVKITFDKKR